MSDFLKTASDSLKGVESARKARAKLEDAAAVKLAKAKAAFDEAKAAHAATLESARMVEAAAWRDMMGKLGATVELVAQIADVDVAVVRAALGEQAKPGK